MEHAFHASGTEDLVQRKEGQEQWRHEFSDGLALQNVAPEDQLGIPGNDRLIQVVENELVGSWHEGKLKTCLGKWNFNLR